MIPPFKIQVRFSDLDIMGHVNNTVYLSYFEMTRVHYFNYLVGENWDWKRFGVVLAKNSVEYRKSILLNHEPEIFMKTKHIGTKSFTLSYEILVDKELMASGESVLVAYDADKGESIVVPELLKLALEKLI